MKILVVDDSAFMRNAISKMIALDPSLQVVGTAGNGQIALDKIAELKPDVVTLDIEMPVMDGLTALRKIQALPEPRPAVLMCSSLTKQGSHEALTALSLGAADVIAKDASQFSLTINNIREGLVAKIKAIGAHRRHTAAAPPTPAPRAKPPRLRAADFDVLLIGSSTGGPPVLEKILTSLPADFPLPIVIAQHMPALFTRTLAERLDSLSHITITQAAPGTPLQPGHAYVGEGGKHVRLVRSATGRLGLEVSERPTEALYKPAVNELFASAARACGQRALALVLTGMGDDGKIGAQDLKAKNATIIAQNMESCVVYGMPKAVNDAGLTLASLNPAQIVDTLLQLRAATAETPSPRSAA